MILFDIFYPIQLSWSFDQKKASREVDERSPICLNHPSWYVEVFGFFRVSHRQQATATLTRPSLRLSLETCFRRGYKIELFSG
jgi:hypothetical protein